MVWLVPYLTKIKKLPHYLSTNKNSNIETELVFIALKKIIP
jgi:hypothetical protein